MHEVRRYVIAENERGRIEQVHVEGEEREPQVQVRSDPALLHEVQRIRQMVANLVRHQGRREGVQRHRDEDGAGDGEHGHSRRCHGARDCANRSVRPRRHAPPKSPEGESQHDPPRQPESRAR